MQSAETVLDVLREHHDIVTGEPGDRKRSRRVREGGVGEGPARAPRRRRTSARCHPGAIAPQWTRERCVRGMGGGRRGRLRRRLSVRASMPLTYERGLALDRL